MGEMPTLFDFGIKWSPIHWRATLDRIQDKDIFPAQGAGADDLVEQLSGRSNEGLAFQVFFLTGSFSEKAEAGLGITDSKHGLFSIANQFGTAAAGGDFGLQNVECPGTLGR
jgi:hypothetical protein